MNFFRNAVFSAPLAAIASLGLATGTGAADLMIVFDGSGSMWGQIGGRTKIEIARETLSGVLGGVSPEQNIGMIAYGHRVRGQCSDIEMVVPLAPAAQSVPQITASANRLNPIGMTPLSDSVRQAADYLSFTERAATVVLITDGIETCNADPCALGAELERLGLDFTAHVVGFGMSEEEGAQVACLAENTGGRFFLANDPQTLADALAQTIGLDDDFIPEESEMARERDVHLLLRDIEGGDLLRGRTVLDLAIIPASEAAPVPDIDVPTPAERASFTARGTLSEGDYMLTVAVRDEMGKPGYTASLPFTVEAGDDVQIIDRVIGARLTIVPMISVGEPFSRGLPSATHGEPHLGFRLMPVVDGLPHEARLIEINAGTAPGGNGVRDVRLAPGTWLVHGTLGRVFAREKLIELAPGEALEFVFDFEASRVVFDFDDGGVPVRTPTFYPHDGPNNPFWIEARFRGNDGQLLPLFMPVGTWILRGGDYHNRDNNAEIVLDVPAPGQIITVRPRAGDAITGADLGIFNHPAYPGCLNEQPASRPCLVEQAAY